MLSPMQCRRHIDLGVFPRSDRTSISARSLRGSRRSDGDGTGRPGGLPRTHWSKYRGARWRFWMSRDIWSSPPRYLNCPSPLDPLSPEFRIAPAFHSCPGERGRGAPGFQREGLLRDKIPLRFVVEELRDVVSEYQLEVADGTVALFGDDDFLLGSSVPRGRIVSMAASIFMVRCGGSMVAVIERCP
jgi:hypothetical protein